MIELAQYIAFVLYREPAWTPELRAALEELGGPLRHLGAWHPFDRTDYYRPEMGETHYRSVVSFEKMLDPSLIGAEKQRSIALENRHRDEQGNRLFNFDVGYMDADKIVLPSCKRGPWKLYTGDGIWLDLVMHYAKGAFTGSPWAFEDFVRNPYQRDLLLIREKYKKSLRTLTAATSEFPKA